MHTKEGKTTLIRRQKDISESPSNSGQNPTGVKPKSARQVQGQGASLSKVDSRYWLKQGKLVKFKRSANYSFQTQFKGERVAFSTRTSNREAAAKVAARIYADIVEMGVEAAKEKHRPTRAEEVATIGEYLAAAFDELQVRDATKAAYGIHLRRIAGDILRVRTERKAKPRKGGKPNGEVKRLRSLREKIEDAPLSILTPDSVEKWKKDFVERAKKKTNERTAQISANSIIRQARSLFAAEVVANIKHLRLPEELPFSGVKLFPVSRKSLRYVSKIDAGEILRKAYDELLDKAPEQFLVIFLGVVAGLRRGEIDRLLWSHVDFRKRQIFVEDTEAGAVKSEDSRGAVDIDERTAELLRGFNAKAKSEFVIDAPEAEADKSSRLWGFRYRCTSVFEKVTAWLRANGVEGNKPLHTLRKEAGSIIATQHGIFAASKFLRHADIRVTADYYADKKTPTTIDVSSLLDAKEDTPENVTFIDKRTAGQKAKLPRKNSA